MELTAIFETNFACPAVASAMVTVTCEPPHKYNEECRRISHALLVTTGRVPLK
jgi:hypothetical protein